MIARRNNDRFAKRGVQLTSVWEPGGALTLSYDALSALERLQRSDGIDEIYIYTPGEERIWTDDVPNSRSTWRIRGLNAEVLREYTNTSSGWSRSADYV